MSRAIIVIKSDSDPKWNEIMLAENCDELTAIRVFNKFASNLTNKNVPIPEDAKWGYTLLDSDDSAISTKNHNVREFYKGIYETYQALGNLGKRNNAEELFIKAYNIKPECFA